SKPPDAQYCSISAETRSRSTPAHMRRWELSRFVCQFDHRPKRRSRPPSRRQVLNRGNDNRPYYRRDRHAGREPARAMMLSALLDGRALTAHELAFAARVTPQTDTPGKRTLFNNLNQNEELALRIG